MNPNLANALVELAQKMGTTAERVFPLLVAKMKFEALLSMSVFGGLAAILLASAAFFLYAVHRKDWDDDLIPLSVLFVAIGMLFLIISFCYISQFFYPEAAAIQSLLRG